MNKILENIIAGPFAGSLDGKEKKAFYQQWMLEIIGVIILLLIGGLLFANPNKTSEHKTIFEIVAATVSMLIFVTAVVHKRIISHLKYQSLHRAKDSSRANRNELENFARDLQQRSQK